ncbi:MAG: alginate lyase family protein [Verrucomicrobia bacterium]|nr:alginate lyase family protein [Verrucomicrobiota bacterium]
MKRSLFVVVSALLALSARAESDAIHRQVEKFNKAWEKPEPSDSDFGIERVLSFLNLDFQGLEQVKAAAAKKDYAAAEKELLAYFKSTRIPAPVESLSSKMELHAEDALRHYFRGNRDAHPPVFRGADIDWTARAVVDGKEIHDAEWYYQFQRLTWWPALARAYAVTRDENYFFEWRYEMADWAADNLPITRETPKFVRRGMETYNRCERLTDALPYMIQSEHFDAKTLSWFLVSFHEQAEHIRTAYAAKGNHLLGELSVVFLNGVNFPEFKLSAAWRNDALNRLPQMMIEEVYDDGMNKELVFSYHTMYISLFAQAYDLFRQNGYEGHLPAEYYERLLKMAEIHALQSFPDNTICQFGDAHKDRSPAVVFRKALAPFAADIPYFDYMVSSGAKGTPPARRNAAYPQSGFYFFRSEWSRSAVFMLVKCSPGGAWHNQIDNGTFELFAYGRNLMNDSGSYMYGSTSTEDQRWRDWFRSTKAHQTLTLDNRDIDLKPEHVLWSESENLTALVIENQSYPELKHRRTVLFVDNQYFLIYDEAVGEAAGDVRAHFQFVPCKSVLQGLSAQTQYPKGANLLVKTFPQGKDISAEEEEGWISYQPQVKEPRPAWSWKVRKTAGDTQVTFLTALIPYREGEAPEVVEASVVAGGFLLCVDGREYRVEVDVAEKSMNLTTKEF